MIYIYLNLLPIVVATMLGLAIGAAYHTVSAGRGPVSAGTVAIAALGEFWLCAILAGALILAPNKASAWVMAVGSAVVIWAGFVLPTVAITHRFRASTLGVTLGDCGYWLVAMMAQAVVMKLIGLVPPPVG